MSMRQQNNARVPAMTCWQVTGNRRYLRVFGVAGYRWTAVLSWYSEQECAPTAPTAFWLLRLGPGAPCNRDAPVLVVRAVRFLPADLDRSTAHLPPAAGGRRGDGGAARLAHGRTLHRDGTAGPV